METSSQNPSTPAANGEMTQAYKRLRNLIHCIAISLIILTGTVFVFILREVVMVRGQTRKAVAYIQEFQDSNLPLVMQQLQKELFEFAQKNADFRPVLARYMQPRPGGAAPVAGTNTTAPVVTTPQTNR